MRDETPGGLCFNRSSRVTGGTAGVVRAVLVIVAWLALQMAAATGALAGERVALVLANGGYVNAPPLPNANRDGQTIAESLRRLGFKVFEGVDLDLDATRALVRDYAYALEGAELALFYYAGHGLQVGGENYIVPIDAKLEQELDLSFQAMPLAQITSAIERQDRTAILILDACRDNPFVPRLSRTLSRSRSTGQGLAGVSPGLGTLVVFATDPGKVAFDGQGANSPFTASLARHMETPGLEIRQVMTRVRLDVLQATDGAQRPWDNSSLLSDVYLAPAAAAPAVASETAPVQVAALPSTPSATDEQRYWDGVQQIGDPERKGRALEGYLKEFPQGRFAMLAGIQLEEIKAPAAKPAEPQIAALPPKEDASQARVLSPGTGPTAVPPVATTPPPEASAELGERALALDAGDRRRVQGNLNRLGYTVGTPDGVLGPRSRAAIADFQKGRGLGATGFLDGVTLGRLASEAARIAATQPTEPTIRRERPPVDEAERPQRQASEPPPNTFVMCRTPNDPSWSEGRLISLASCRQLNGRWTMP